MNPVARRVVTNAVLTLGVLALCEGAMRMRPTRSPPTPPGSVGEVRPSRTTLWTVDPWESDSTAIRPLRILVCGEDDAAVTTESARWPRYLSRSIDRMIGTDSVVVRSIAVPGFTALQGERALRAALEDWSPDLVLLQFGSGNEFQPAIDSRSDQDWLVDVGGESSESGSRLLDWIRSAIDLPVPADRPASDVVRVDGVAFERALERMIARVRGSGACPVVVEPVRRPSRGAPDRDDAIAGVYRQIAARVAGVYGVPFVALENALALDRGPFRNDSRLLSSRGAKVVARECLRTLIVDSAVLITIQRWFERNASAPEAGLIAGTFGMMRTFLIAGPAATPADTVLDVLLRARDRGDAKQRRAACLRLAIARHRGDAIEETQKILEECAAADEDPDRATILASLQILNGRGAEARGALSSETGHDGALAATLRGISLLTVEPATAIAEFDRAIELDPTLVLPDLWRAKSALIAGDLRTAEIHCDLAARMKDCHGSGSSGLRIASAGSGRVESFLNTDPVLFGTEQRAAMPRILFALAIDSETRRPDSLAFLERAYANRESGRPDAYAKAIEQARGAIANATDRDELLTCAWFALERRDPEVARDYLPPPDSNAEYSEARFARAVYEFEVGRPESAIPLLDAVLQENPDDPRVLYYSAAARFAVGDNEAARNSAERAARRWPDHRELIQLRERIENAAKKP